MTAERGARRRILTILARAGAERYPRAEEDLAALLSRQLSTAQRDLVIVDNLLPPGVHDRSASQVLIGGDNACWEFSAFDAALVWLGERVHDYDWIHLATSAFGELYTSYLERFTEPVLGAAEGRPVCLCHIDCYNEPIRILGRPSQHWARTAFLMLPPTELVRVGSLTSVRDRGAFFSGDPDQPFRADAPLSPVFRQYILDWLTGREIGQGVSWHSRIPLTGDTLPRFEQKAMAILNEHLLSIRLRAQGCLLLDVTWLSARLGARQPVEWTAGWRAQLAGRDRDAIHLQPA